MSFEAVSFRLAALQETNAQIKELIDRLANIKFQPGSIPLNGEDDGDNVMTELTAEIQQTIKEQDEDFEVLQEEVLDLDAGRVGSELEERRTGLEGAVKRGFKVLKSHEIAFRKAQLTARRNLLAAQKQERELLLQSYLEPPRSSNSSPLPDQQQQQWQHQRNHKSKGLTAEEKELNASSDFTLALRRTHETMAAELSRSQFAHDTLKESTAALESLGDQYSTLDTMLSRSKNLLGTLVKSNKSDTWYLETAFYVLSATIVWLVWRRLLYGPTWWLVWFPMKMFIKGWVGVFTAVGILGGQPDGSVTAISDSFPATGVSSVVHTRATRGPKVSGGKPPVVHVGGGGRGAPMKGPNVPGVARQEGAESFSEQVGRIIDESKERSAVLEEDERPEGNQAAEEEKETVENLSNPKKRMWEEEMETVKEAERPRDEL